MPKSLQRPVVLLTGASSGIGYDVAPLLVRYGYTVYGAARRVEKIEELASEGVKTLILDVTDEASMEAAVQQIIDAEGRIDVLINNAGYGSYGAIEDVPIDEARRQFEVNLFGLARLTQLVLPHMRAQGSGRILNISSMAGRITSPLGAWYHATKYALEAFSDALRMEVEEFGIDVVIIEPGGIKTPGDLSRQTTWRNPPETVSTRLRCSGLRQTCVSSTRPPLTSRSPRLSLTLFCGRWRRAAPRPATWWVSVLNPPCSCIPCYRTVSSTRSRAVSSRTEIAAN